MTILAQDTFAGRTVGSGTSWGTASDGNVWARTSANNFTVLSVGGGEGKAHGGGTNNFMLLGSGTATDQEGLVRLAMGQTGDSLGLILRSSADGSTCYYAEIGDFTNDVAVYKFVSGTRTMLDIQAAGFTVSNGSFYWMRFQVIGTTLKMRLWASGSGEPGTWQSTVTDGSIASGQYGIFLNTFDATDAQFDSYQANDTSTTANNPFTTVDTLLGSDTLLTLESVLVTAIHTVSDGGTTTTSMGMALDVLVASDSLVMNETIPTITNNSMACIESLAGTDLSSMQGQHLLVVNPFYPDRIIYFPLYTPYPSI